MAFGAGLVATESFVDRLESVMLLMNEERGWNQARFCDEVGVSTGSIARWRKGGEPGVYKVAKIAEMSAVRLEWLILGTGEMRQSDLRSVPSLDLQVSAGSGAYNDCNFYAEKTLFSETWLREQVGNLDNLAQIEVVGWSMLPTFKSGDRVLVREGPEFQGDGIYVLETGGLLQVKRLVVIGDRVEVRSDNPEYPAISMTREEFDRDYRIVAKVVWGGREY